MLPLTFAHHIAFPRRLHLTSRSLGEAMSLKPVWSLFLHASRTCMCVCVCVCVCRTMFATRNPMAAALVAYMYVCVCVRVCVSNDVCN